MPNRKNLQAIFIKSRAQQILLSVLVIALPACSLFNGDSDLISNLKKWQNKKTDSYSFTVEKKCFCPREFYPATVIVAKDTVHLALDPETGESIPIDTSTTSYTEIFPTINDLFDLIKKADQQDADILEITYDNKIGYPKKIVIDYDKRIADDEITYTISDYSTD